MVIRKLWLFSLIESGHRPKEKSLAAGRKSSAGMARAAASPACSSIVDFRPSWKIAWIWNHPKSQELRLERLWTFVCNRIAWLGAAAWSQAEEKRPEWPAPPLVPHVHLSSISGRRGKSLGSGTTRIPGATARTGLDIRW